MPTYRFVCTACGRPYEVFQGMHDERPSICPSCGGKLDRIFEMPNISATALYVKGKSTRYERIKETNLRYDLDAYKRLRRDGFQPAQINGAYAFEQHAGTDRAVTEFELGFKRVLKPDERTRARDVLKVVEDVKAGLSEATPR